MTKILFVIADYPDKRQDFFLKWMSPRNKEYASKHGFEYRELLKLPRDENGNFFRNNPTWLKFKIIKDWIDSGDLKHGDIVSHIDADICIFNTDKSFQTSKSFGYAIDSCNTHCMGAYTLTINDWSIDMLNTMLSDDLFEKCKEEDHWKAFREQAAWYTMAGILPHSWQPFNTMPHNGFHSKVTNNLKYSIDELEKHVEVFSTEWNVTHVAGEGFNDYFMIPTHRKDTIFRHFAGGGLWDEAYFTNTSSEATLEPSHLRCAKQFKNNKKVNVNLCNSNFINTLINSLGLRSYLELGLGNFETFSNVNCEKKLGVDIDNEKSKFLLNENEKVVIDSTTNFLKNTKEKFDIIFIDADHHRNSVLDDAINALDILSPKGIICFHDIGPTEVNQTLETACGSAYKAWINIRNGNLGNNLYLCSYEQDDPTQDSYTSIIGVLCRTSFDKTNFLEKKVEENWESYEKNRSEILNVLNVEEMIKILDLKRE